MKAARFYEAKKPLVVEDVDVPKINDDEALVNIKACGVCGTDVHIAVEGTLPVASTPLILGHEPSGEIVETGKDVKNFKKGDRVIALAQDFCGSCFYCRQGREALCIKGKVLGLHRDGALAEYVKINERNLLLLPENVSFEVGAILCDAVATPYHALTSRGKISKGETVAIFGCGGLGFHAVKIAKLFGCKVLAVDVSDVILQRAVDAGADEAIHSGTENAVKKIKELTKFGVDASFEFVGLPETIDAATRALRRAGRCVLCGIGHKKMELMPSSIFVGMDVALLGSMGMDMQDIKEVVELVSDGVLDLKDSVTKIFPLDEVNGALEALHKKTGNPVRFVVRP